MAFVITTDEPIIRITLSGTLTNEDLSALGRDSLELERAFAVVPHRLTDVRPVTRLEITFGGILQLAELRLRQTFPNEFKSAIVASDVAHYGFARMFQTLNDHPQISIGIFRDSGPALQWLEGPDRDPPKESWGIRANAL